MSKKQKLITVMGGGTGTSALLSGLKKYPVSLSAIITTADDGSSSGTLRKEFNMIPPGDIRQCLVALAAGDFNYLNDRFQKGFLQGHTLGNLLITLFYQKNGNFQEAIDALLALVGATGSLIPMTLKPATLVAKFDDGRIIRGQSAITTSREISKKLKKLALLPTQIKANPRAIAALQNADVVIVGPGNLYASILPHFLIPEIKKAFIDSSAKEKIYVANLFAQPGHTDNFSVPDFMNVLKHYIGKDIFTHIIYNTLPIPTSAIKTHANSAIGAPVSLPNTFKADKRFIGHPLASVKIKHHTAADPLAGIRNPFLHDSEKLAGAIIKLI